MVPPILVKRRVLLMRRFWRVPGEIFNIFLTSELFSHCFGLAGRWDENCFFRSLRSSMRNSCKSSLVIISAAIVFDWFCVQQRNPAVVFETSYKGYRYPPNY